jgi:hypothetical protein
MTSYPARLLGLGDDQTLLHGRRAILRSAGYDAQTATLWEVELLLRTRETFDLVIVSSGLNELRVDLILSAAGETAPYVLERLTLPVELLAQVERRLASADQPKWVR